MRTIKLTSAHSLDNGQPIWIDIGKIVYFKDSNNSNKPSTYMKLVANNDDFVFLKESPEEIAIKLDEMREQTYNQRNGRGVR